MEVHHTLFEATDLDEDYDMRLARAVEVAELASGVKEGGLVNGTLICAGVCVVLGIDAEDIKFELTFTISKRFSVLLGIGLPNTRPTHRIQRWRRTLCGRLRISLGEPGYGARDAQHHIPCAA